MQILYATYVTMQQNPGFVLHATRCTADATCTAMHSCTMRQNRLMRCRFRLPICRFGAIRVKRMFTMRDLSRPNLQHI
ncbi:unnamed protein product [Angiostrongylus costaricensis]|uniref:Secreted protein n=1 Tax=Angiostrongylus costaricensis TaxID=334426 RepID=A0A0R3PJP1_ANGCS|nr:unnamed protein product [Angiostrongylus costaricensis]